jgi:HK97 family phage portal protein
MGVIGNFFAGAIGSTTNLSNPAQWLIDLSGGEKTVSGERVTAPKSLSVAAIFACVRNLSEDCAKLKFITYKRNDDESRDRAVDHELYSILRDEFNDEMTAMAGRTAVTACAMLYGNGYAEITRKNNGKILGFIPLHPVNVTAKRKNDTKKLYYEVRKDDGTTRDVFPRDMIVITGFGFNGIIGEMISSVGKESIGLCIATDKFASSFFGNGANVSGILKHPGSPRAEQRKIIRDSVFKKHEGSANANKILLVWDGMEFTPTSVDPQKAQAVESRQFQVEEVCRWFRMPPHKIFHLARAQGWSTLEQTNMDYLIDTLQPWLERWEQEIQRKCLKDTPEYYVEHLPESLLRMDAKTRAEVNRIEVFAGRRSINEWRRQDNEPGIGPEGDTYWIQSSMIPVENAAMGVPKSGKQNTENGGRDAQFSTNAYAEKVKLAQMPAFSAACQRVVNYDNNRLADYSAHHTQEQIDKWLPKHKESVLNYGVESILPVLESMAMLIDADADCNAIASVMMAKYCHERMESPTMAAELTDIIAAMPKKDCKNEPDKLPE